MLAAMLKAQWLTLVRDRLALFLVFVLPVIFFSVFAIIFGGAGQQGSSKPAATKVAVLDLDDSRTSEAMHNALSDLSAVETTHVSSLVDAESSEPKLQEEQALRLVRNNAVDAAVVFPKGLEDSVANFGGDRVAVKVFYDSANPLAQNMLTGVLQGAAFTSVPDVLISKGMEQFRSVGGPFSAQQNAAVAQFMKLMGSESPQDQLNEDSPADTDAEGTGSAMSMNDGIIRIETVSAQEFKAKPGAKPRSGSMIAYYAASVAVMFLMFSMAGSASALLEYQENGTLERLISGQMKISQLLTSHWLFFVLSGVAQLAVMFTFAAFVFGVDLSRGPVLLGTVIMTIVTSMACASFIIMLATLCRSRKQLESVSTTIILVMSAFGGSMIPRPFLPSFVRETSKLTFNGWALDGFLKVLWYYDPSQSILTTLVWHVVVILLMAGGFLAIAQWRVKSWAVA